MIRPEPDFLRSFDALERSLRALPHQEALLPPPIPPAPEVLDPWLKPYRGWNLPKVYLDYIARYGGVTSNVPPIGIGIRPLVTLLESRRKREAIGLVFDTPAILLSPGNIDGDLHLVSSDKWAEPRVALMNGDDDIVFQADSFALYLWHSYFFVCMIHHAQFTEYISYKNVPTKELGPFNARLAVELERVGFELLGADSRIICGQREDIYLTTHVRGPNIGVSLGTNRSLHAVSESRADLIALLEHSRHNERQAES